MAIDYKAAAILFPKQKASLTRAKKKGFNAVLASCTRTVSEWNQVGAWPDNWSLWQRTLDDAAIAERRSTVDLSSL